MFLKTKYSSLRGKSFAKIDKRKMQRDLFFSYQYCLRILTFLLVKINCMTFFFFMGFMNDFQMGAIDHFMHFSLLTSSYTLVSFERFWEPRNCISYLSSLNQVNVYCSETKLGLHFNSERRFWLFQHHLCRPQPSDLSSIICHLYNYFYLLKSFLFTPKFA